jgi:hypothetical protein
MRVGFRWLRAVVEAGCPREWVMQDACWQTNRGGRIWSNTWESRLLREGALDTGTSSACLISWIRARQPSGMTPAGIVVYLLYTSRERFVPSPDSSDETVSVESCICSPPAVWGRAMKNRRDISQLHDGKPVLESIAWLSFLELVGDTNETMELFQKSTHMGCMPAS